MITVQKWGVSYVNLYHSSPCRIPIEQLHPVAPSQKPIRANGGHLHRVLKAIRRLMVRQGMPTQLDNGSREHLESFIEDLLGKWKPATANNRYRGLQTYFGWLVEEGEIKVSPMARMKPPRIPESPPDILDPDDLRKLLKTCEGQGFDERRDRPTSASYWIPGFAGRRWPRLPCQTLT